MIRENIRKYRLYLFLSIISTIIALLLINQISPDSGYDGFVIGFGSSVSAVFFFRLLKNIRHPEEIKQESIEENDERNRTINGMAGFANFRVTTLILCFQIVFFYFMKMEIPLIVSFIALAAQMTGFTVLRNHYEKKM